MKAVVLEPKSLFLLCVSCPAHPLSVSDEVITRIIVEKLQSCDSAVSCEASAVTGLWGASWPRAESSALGRFDTTTSIGCTL